MADVYDEIIDLVYDFRKEHGETPKVLNIGIQKLAELKQRAMLGQEINSELNTVMNIPYYVHKDADHLSVE